MQNKTTILLVQLSADMLDTLVFPAAFALKAKEGTLSPQKRKAKFVGLK